MRKVKEWKHLQRETLLYESKDYDSNTPELNKYKRKFYILMFYFDMLYDSNALLIHINILP